MNQRLRRIHRLTSPFDDVETIYSLAVKARMGPKRFGEWVAKRRQEIEEAG